MSLFRRRKASPPVVASPAPPSLAEGLQHLVESSGGPALFAHSAFVKQVRCASCGAAKRLPSATAYLYCDHCGALVDYDARLANAGTNAAVTNTVFHALMGPVQPGLARARATGDDPGYRALLRGVFSEWVHQCPQAVSPRAANDADFRARMVEYLVESTACKDADPALARLEQQLNLATAALRRIPRDPQPWRADGLRPVADLFRRLMEATYARLEADGVLALDPDHAPAGVPLRMEYSTFCQGWLPHADLADAEYLLALFGLDGQYVEADLGGTVTRRCGGCGGAVTTLPDAVATVCQGCGRRLDLDAGESPCQGCGTLLVMPEGVSRVSCPSCGSATHRV